MSALNVAIREKRFAQVKLLLDIGIDVNKRDSEMRTALMQLCFLEDEAKAAKYAKIFVKRGAKIGLKDKDGLTALSHACKLGQEQLVSMMLEEGSDFDLNAQDKLGNTALHYAAMSGNFVVLNLLLSKLKRYKLSVDICNKKGETPLIVASKSGNFFCSRILVSEGKASKSARDYVEFKTADEWGRTKESLRSASRSPLFRVMQLPPRTSVDSASESKRRRSHNNHSPKQNHSQRPNTAPGNLLNQTSEKSHRENLRELFRVYEGHVSTAFRRGVKPRPIVIREALASPSETMSQDTEIGDEMCDLTLLAASPASCGISPRRFSLNKAGKLAFTTNAAFRRASIATVSTATTNKALQRRGSQAFGASGRRLSQQTITPSPRIRRGSMNVMSKITKVVALNVNKDKVDMKNTTTYNGGVGSNPEGGIPKISVVPDKLLAKLQTLAEESDSAEEENDSEVLARSSPANLFCQL